MMKYLSKDHCSLVETLPGGGQIGKVVPPPIIKAFSLLLGECGEANREYGANIVVLLFPIGSFFIY